MRNLLREANIFPTLTPFSERVDELVERFLDLWWQGEAGFPDIQPGYPPAGQFAREPILSRYFKELTAILGSPAQAADGRKADQQRLLETTKTFAQQGLDLDRGVIDDFLRMGFQEAALGFAHLAHAYDPEMSAEDIYQAGRNAWSMNLFQYLFSLPVQVTPAVFAYSLLYPYTDNYLDDPTISRNEKRLANQRLSARLAGETVAPANEDERHIFELVGVIEGEYDRVHFPRVYESLMAIHQAQINSLRLFDPGASPYELDVLRLDFCKGGTATLADGYLVAGNLSPEQEALVFGYGVFTQLLDDQEDVYRDRKVGLQTIFSQTAGGWSLDGVTNRVFAYKEKALGSMRTMGPEGSQPIVDLLLRGIDLLMIDTVNRNGQFHSRDYLRAMQACFPLRFSAVNRQRRRLDRRKVTTDQLMAFLL